jgi:hypothetical protein
MQALLQDKLFTLDVSDAFSGQSATCSEALGGLSLLWHTQIP